MITVQDLKQIADNGGMTLRAGKPIQYKSGYQVATEGKTRKTLKAVVRAIASYEGNCGLWLSSGIWYIDKSYRVNTKKEAIKIGKENNQISVLQWNKMELVYC